MLVCSGVYGVTPRRIAKRIGSSLSARGTVTCPSTFCGTEPEPEPELEPQQEAELEEQPEQELELDQEPEQEAELEQETELKPLPVHWGRTQTSALPKLAVRLCFMCSISVNFGQRPST